MKGAPRRQISMARRAFNFATAHPVADGGFTTVLAGLKADIESADSLGMLQSAGPQRQHAAVNQRFALKQSIRSLQLSRLGRVAKLGSISHPELKNQFPLPDAQGPNRTFLLQAQVMLNNAIAQQDLLKTLGLGDTFIDDLTKSLNDFETATEDAHAGRADHIGASAQVDVIAARCVADVDVLDTYMRSSYAADLQTLTAWSAAKNIHGAAHRADAAPSDARQCQRRHPSRSLNCRRRRTTDPSS